MILAEKINIASTLTEPISSVSDANEPVSAEAVLAGQILAGSTLTEPASTGQNLIELVEIEKLQLLFRQSYPAVFVSIFNACLLSAILWSVQDHSIILGWLTIILGTAITRFYFFTRYQCVLPQGEDVLSWKKPYFITLLFSSLAWGIGSVYVMPESSPLHQIVIFAFLLGMSGGALSVYSTHRAITWSTIIILLLPATIWFFAQKDIAFIGLAMGAVIFLVSSVRAISATSLTLHQNLLMTHELKKSKEKAEALARVDELTGLYNRRAFYEFGNVLINQAQRKKEPLAMIMMDIDNFKKINDSYGHAAGDVALQKIGEVLFQRLRKSDIFARIGGEEFAMLLPATSIKQAKQLAEELREVISTTVITGVIADDKKDFYITASFGVATGDSDIDALARCADKAMYQSKDSGRNTVVCDV